MPTEEETADHRSKGYAFPLQASTGLRKLLPCLLVIACSISLLGAPASPVTFAQTPTSTPLPPPPDLVLDGRRVELTGEHVFGDVLITNRGRLEIQPHSGRENTGHLVLHADRLVLDRSSSIIGEERGYRGIPRQNGEGPGGGEGGRNAFDGGAGGAYGGNGGDGVLDGQARAGSRAGRSYGKDCDEEVEPGSAGGAPGSADNSADPGRGGHGGAALSIIADTVLITGTITLNGEDGMVSANDSGGGGAGGGLMIKTRHLQFSGRVEADGGIGAVSDDGGGGGGGGRVKIFYIEGDVARRGITVNGGRGDGNGFPNDGRRGTVCIQVIPPTATPEISPTPTATATPSASPSPAITASPTPTASPTSTHSATPSPTHTTSPTATSTPLPSELFLPLLLRERCPKTPDRKSDIVLVLDASTSMAGATRAGRSKIQAAVEAAQVPVSLVAASRSSRLAIVTFHHEARVASRLSRDPSVLSEALESIRLEQGSRLDEGILLASQVLEARDPESQARIVLVTDGRPAPSTPEDVRVAAAQARELGILVDTIGLGDDLDAELLASIASGPDRVHLAPDAEDLAGLFSELTWEPLPCGGTPVWP